MAVRLAYDARFGMGIAKFDRHAKGVRLQRGAEWNADALKPCNLRRSKCQTGHGLGFHMSLWKSEA
jgi:hypothetical protein